MPEIAAELLIGPGTVRHVVDSLQVKGLVSVHGNNVELTGRGKGVHRSRIRSGSEGRHQGLDLGGPPSQSADLSESDERLMRIIDEL
ncbi:hypothetical protein [Phytoactinopolyspora limicola]|uniref:hypothetical protein n=1 Tax=Phytoactinopolyspora limicola TaxID=2715536 RepID=UPI00140BA799|nr:hypothetical protein [Phytoactinopolyspora limicola]